MTDTPPVTLQLLAAPGADPESDLSLLDPGDWVDWSDRLVGQVTWQVGRLGIASQTDPAQLDVVLDNEDGYLTPGNNASPYYPHIDKRTPVPLRLLAALEGQTPVEQVTCFIKSLRLDFDTTGDYARVSIQAKGRLDWLDRIDAPTVSSSGGTVVASDPVAYWPLTDPTGASQAASGLTGGVPMTKSGSLKFGTGQGLPSQPNILDLGALKNTIGSLSAPIPAGTSSTSWRVEFQLCWARLTATDDAIGPNWTTAGTIAGWQIYYRHSDARITLRYSLDGSGTFVELDTTKTSPYDGTTRIYRVTADQNGTGVDVVLTIDGVSYLSTTIAAQTLGRPVQAKLRSCFSFNSGYDGSQAPAVGHYTFWAPYSAPSTDTLLAATGYAGESAGDRLERLFLEATDGGLPITIEPGDTVPMGIQQDGTFAELVRQCEAADAGLLHDGGPYGAMVYQPRSSRYNRSPDLILSITEYHQIADGFSGTMDDRSTVKALTVNTTDGDSGTYTDDTVKGGSAGSLDLNIYATEDPAQHASWRVAIANTTDLVHDALPLGDLAVETDILTAWQDSRRVGLRCTVVDLPGQMSPLPLELFADGFAADCDGFKFRVALAAVPARPYEVMVLATSAATLMSAVDADDTTWTSVVDAPPRWTTTDVPLALTCGGEDPVVATAIADVAATYVAAGTAAHADNASVTPTLPAGVQAGDLLLIVASIRSSGTGTPNTPSGYTHMAGWHNLRLYGKIHTGSESNPTVTFTGGSAGDTTSADMIALRGTVADPAEAIIDWADYLNTSAANIAYPPLPAPMWDGCVLLAIGWKQDDWTSVAALAGWTEAFDIFSTTGSDQGLVCDYQIQTTATAIASGSFTVTGGTSQISRALMVVIAPGRSTLTVTRATNGTAISHAAGDAIEVSSPGIVAL